MKLQRSTAATVATFILCLVPCVHAEDEPVFWALFDNGDQHTGEKVDDWFHPEHMPKLHGRNLLDDNNPVRVIRNRQAVALKPSAHLELANGDIVPGRVERFEPATSDSVAAVVVSSPLAGPAETLRVRADLVRRITSNGRMSDYAPGFLQTQDGKRQLADRLRFASDSLRGLTPSGTVSASYLELREAHFEVAEPLTAWREGVWLADFEPQQFFVHLRTSRGARLTFPRALAQADLKQPSGTRSPLFVVQPLWSLDPLFLKHEDVALASYFRLRELPLSLFAPQAVEERAAISHYNWTANEALRGGLLNLGELTADLGLATHSYTALTYVLPSQAEEFFTIVGIDPSCREGGCARAAIHRDSAAGPQIWQSDFLRGGQDPVRVGPLDLRGAKQLVLITDFAHQGRPAGADPWDVRDFVNWLMPVVRLSGDAWQKFPKREPAELTPELAGWTIADPQPIFARRPYWDKKKERYRFALTPSPPGKPQEAASLVLSRRMKVDWSNAWLALDASRNVSGDTYHEISVQVNGEELTCVSGPLKTSRPSNRDWLLGQFAGQEVEVTVTITPQGSGEPPGVIFDQFDFTPVIRDPAEGAGPIHPDVAIESLNPQKVEGLPADQSLQAAKRTDGEPLFVREVPLQAGLGVPVGTSITYDLKPEYRRFAAVVGLVNEVGGVGPFEVLLDGEPHFSTGKDRLFKRPDRAEQINIEIPAGHKTITLKLSGERDFGAWGEAGFLVE